MAGTSTEHAVTSRNGHSVDHSVSRPIDCSVNQPLDPVACEGEASTMPLATAGNAIATDMAGEQAHFPFMKLPTELRVMVYNYHFFQPIEHLTPLCWATVQPEDVAECTPGGPVCRLGVVNKGVHLGNLWIASKTIYHEVMPIYFSTHYFQFASIETLGHFLATIPHYHRQHITKLRFNYSKTSKTNNFDVQQAFRLLSECPNLIELAIGVWWNDLLRSERTTGMKALLQVRGVETLEIKFIDFKLLLPMQQEVHGRWATLFARRLSVLKGPYSPAESKRREARGITKETVLRNCFDRSETDTRAARYERRMQLKEIA